MIEHKGLTKRYGDTPGSRRHVVQRGAGEINRFLPSWPNLAGNTTAAAYLTWPPDHARSTVNSQAVAELAYPIARSARSWPRRLWHAGAALQPPCCAWPRPTSLPRRRVGEVLAPGGRNEVAREASRLSLGMGQRLGCRRAARRPGT